MISARMMSEDIDIHYRAAPSPNAYNTPQRVPGASVTVKGYFRPRRSNTVVTDGETLKTDATIMVSPTVDVEHIEYVVVHGVRYSLDGEPLPHWNPLSRGIEYYSIYLRRGVS